MNAEEIRIEKAAIRSEKIRFKTDPYLHKNAAMWLGNEWGLQQNNKPVPVPNLIFRLPTVVDRNQVGRLTITQRVRLARADAILKAKQVAQGIRIVTLIEKLCATCNTTKKVAEFNKSTKRNDGLQLRCKRCQASANAKSYKRRQLKELQGEANV